MPWTGFSAGSSPREGKGAHQDTPGSMDRPVHHIIQYCRENHMRIGRGRVNRPGQQRLAYGRLSHKPQIKLLSVSFSRPARRGAGELTIQEREILTGGPECAAIYKNPSLRTDGVRRLLRNQLHHRGQGKLDACRSDGSRGDDRVFPRRSPTRRVSG